MADVLASRCLRAVLAILLAVWFFGAQESSAAECREAAPHDWTAIEKEAWQWLVEGIKQSEDKATEDKETEDKDYDATTFSSKPRERVIRARFFREIIECDARHASLSRFGLALKSVFVPETIDLSLQDVPVRFSCKQCVMAGIDGRRSRWREPLVLDGSQLHQGFDFRFAEFADEFSAQGLKSSSNLVLDQAIVKRTVNLMGMQADGKLSMRDSKVGEKLKLDGASLDVLDLGGSKVGGQLILSGITIRQQAVLDRMSVGGDLLLRTYKDSPKPTIGLPGSGEDAQEGAEPQPETARYALVLNNTSIGGRLEIAHARIYGRVSLDAIRVKEDIWLRDCSLVEGRLNMPFARIGQNFDLSTTELSTLNATGSEIGGELRLGTAGRPNRTPPIWDENGQIVLRNVSVSAWVDAADSNMPRYDQCPAVEGAQDPWPPRIDVIGFSYARAGGLGGGNESERPEDWYVDWLDRQEPFSLDPYRRLANYLKENGRDTVAKSILFAAKERQLSKADTHSAILLFLQKVFVGYGLYTWFMLFWLVGFIILGGLIFSRSEEGRTMGVPLRFTYSTDMFLPFIHLRKVHGEIEFQGPVKYYLYFHKLMGWICASFFVSALAGLFDV